MPQLALAVGAAAAAAKGMVVLSMALSLAGALVGQAEAKRQARKAARANTGSGIQEMWRTSAPVCRVILGQRMVSGNPLYMGTTDAAGAKNGYLHIVLPLAAHRCEAVDAVYLGDTLATDPKFAGLVRVNVHLGDDDQLADADAVAEIPGWTTDHRLLGTCYLYVRLKWEAGKWPTGLPAIRALVRGARPYDPRTGTSAWTRNWALNVAWYLEWIGTPRDEIDVGDLVEAANVSDELVDLDGLGAYQARYQIDAVVETDQAPRDALDALATAGAGWVYPSGGTVRIRAGAYRVPTLTLTADDLRGSVEVQARRQISDLVNTRTAKYPAAPQFQDTTTPPRSSALWLAEDLGEVLADEIDLPHTTDGIAAQRLVRISLERLRQQTVVVWPAKWGALPLVAGDTVAVDLAALGWDGKEFEVQESTLSEDGSGVDLVLAETAAAVWEWNHGDAWATDPAPDTDLPDPWDVPEPTGLTLASGSAHLWVQGDGTVVSRLWAEWQIAPGAFASGHHVEWRRLGDTQWARVTLGPQVSAVYLAPVADGEYYEVRVRATNALGASSDWVAPSVPHRIVGKTEPPPAPDWVRAVGEVDGTRTVEWALSAPPPDLAGYRIRASASDSAGWEEMVPVHGGLVTDSPHRITTLFGGTYRIGVVTVDTTGLESTATYSDAHTAAAPTDLLVAAYPHALGWPGGHDGAVDGSGVLRPPPATWAGLPATWAQWAGTGGWWYPAAQSLTYTHTVDVGVVIPARPWIAATGDGVLTVEVRWAVVADDWSPWVVAVSAGAGEGRWWQVRVQVSGPDPALRVLVVGLRGRAVREELPDLATASLTGALRIGVGDVRVPVTQAYRAITQVVVSPHEADLRWEVVDRQISPGPRIRLWRVSQDLVVTRGAGGVVTDVATVEVSAPVDRVVDVAIIGV